MENAGTVRLRQGFAASAAKVLQGEQDFGQFLKATKDTWYALAAYLMRRWRSPRAIELEDVVQELYVGAFRASTKFDPARGVPFHSYLVWNACDKAKKKIHKWRGAVLHGSPDRAMGRFHIAASDLPAREREGDQSARVLEVVVEPTQLDDFEYRSRWQSMAEEMPTPRLYWGMLALGATRGEVDAAARALYDTVDLRLALRLACEAMAVHVVKQARDVAYEVAGVMRAA